MVIVVMGVSACGKSSVGKALAETLDWPFKDGDELHPQANIDKMHAGHPLDDGDRWPWLARVADWISARNPPGHHGVVACSALRRTYRDRLRKAKGEVRFVFLDVPPDELQRRLQGRRHFMPASLLQSQLQTLERPADDEPVLTISGTPSMEDTIARILRWMDHGG